MRSTKLIRAAVAATVLAFGAVALAPAPQAAADGIEGIRPKPKPAPKRKPKPVAPKAIPAPPPPVIYQPAPPAGPQELTLPSSFFEGSGGVGVNITGGGGGGVVIVTTTTHGGGGFSGFTSRPAFFSNVSGGGKGC